MRKKCTHAGCVSLAQNRHVFCIIHAPGYVPGVRSYSKIACQFTDAYQKKNPEYNVVHKHYNSETFTLSGREHRINGVGKQGTCVDGYIEESKTVIEFHGDFWHGNNAMYDPDKMNTVAKRSFGDLYKSTMARMDKIKALGYTVVYIWERDFNLWLKKKDQSLPLPTRIH